MRTRLFNLSFLPAIVLALIISFGNNALADDLKIGSASVKITPPQGTPMAGYYFDRGADGVHNDLFAKAVVFAKDGVKAALVTCDLIAAPEYLVKKIREAAEKQTGIKGDYIMISATHSHTGPVIPSKMSGYSEQKNKIHEKYLNDLPGLIAESIKLANASLTIAKASVGTGYEETISFNRRFFMKDGTVGWNPGKLNPAIIKPAGPIDPQVYVLYAETADGKPISTYVNFALHLDNVGGTEISADVPYTVSSILAKMKGSEMVTLYANGCCGNINHLNVKSKDPQKGHDEAKRIGTVLSGEVLKTYTRLQSFTIDKIAAKKEIIYLPLADVRQEELPAAKEVISRQGKPDAPKFIELVNAYKVVDVLNLKGAPVAAELQVIALGNECAVVALPGEIFTEIGMYIKSRSPFLNTIVVELANGNIGYVPDRKAYIEGNYEPLSARCGAGSGELMAENAIRMLFELKSK
jgi:neutral ceramidase